MKRMMAQILLIFAMMVFGACQDSTSGDDEVSLDSPEKIALDDALRLASALDENTVAGQGEGQFPQAAKTALQTEIQKARRFYKNKMSNAPPADINAVTEQLYEACTVFEAQVNSQLTGLIDANATKETRYLYANLKKYAGQNLLFGMHDATGYGVGWQDDDDRSDVKDVCGSYPAVFSWDANAIVRKSKLNRYEYRVRLAYNSGGINTICWHQYDPEGNSFYYDKVNYAVAPTILPGGKYHQVYRDKLVKIANLMKRLRGPDGASIPVIFRPYHEQNGGWFWWGKGHRTEQEFIDLWRFTVHYLRDSLGVHNFIYAFSPDGNQYEAKEEYLIDYPGDDYVDMLGVDFYFGAGNTAEISKFQRRVIDAVEYAQQKNKLAAATEVGDRYGWDDTDMLEIDQWFTRCLLAPIKDHPTARHAVYAAVWRNAHEHHHFAPYPGHPSVPDFLDFYNDPFTVFADDMANVYVFDAGL